MTARAPLTAAAALACMAGAAPAAHGQSAIVIGDRGPATPYPSTIERSGVSPIVEDVDIRVSNLRHSFAEDLDIAVVGPDGQAVMLMSDVGSVEGTCRPDLRFSDQATEAVPSGSLPCGGGTYLPTDDDSDDTDSDFFPAPAPAAFGHSLSVFNTVNPNGPWSLYVMDDAEGDSGDIGSWSIHLNTRQPGLLRFVSSVGSTVRESQQTVSLRIRRSGGTADAPLRAASVAWSTEPCAPLPPGPFASPQTATAGTDFAPAQGTAELAPGETEKTIDIGVTDDRVPEERECFAVRLASTGGDARLSNTGTLNRVGIIDDDSRAASPRVTTGGPQRVLRQNAVIVFVTSRADGTLAATGTIALPRMASAAVRLKPAAAAVTRNQTVRLRLRLSRQARRAVKRALARRRTLRATVRVRATDLAGGTAARTVRVRLRR